MRLRSILGDSEHFQNLENLSLQGEIVNLQLQSDFTSGHQEYTITSLYELLIYLRSILSDSRKFQDFRKYRPER